MRLAQRQLRPAGRVQLMHSFQDLQTCWHDNLLLTVKVQQEKIFWSSVSGIPPKSAANTMLDDQLNLTTTRPARRLPKTSHPCGTISTCTFCVVISGHSIWTSCSTVVLLQTLCLCVNQMHVVSLGNALHVGSKFWLYEFTELNFFLDWFPW